MRLAPLVATAALVACPGPAEAPPEQPLVTIEPSDEDATWAPTPSSTPSQTPPEPSKSEIEDARALFRAGLQAYEQGDYRVAVEHFERAYELSRKPQLLFNLVRAAERDGDRATACRYYRELATQAQREPSLQSMLDRLSSPC